MATYVLGNDVFFRGARLRAGKIVSDAQYPIAQLQSAGALLYPDTGAAASRAAVLQTASREGQDPQAEVAQRFDTVGPFIPISAAAVAGVTVKTGTPAAWGSLSYNPALAEYQSIGPASFTLGDATGTVDVDGSAGLNAGTVASQFVVPAGTLSANRTITLGTAGAVAGEMVAIVRLDVTAHTLAVVNGGVGGGTLITLPNSTARVATFTFDGTNWALATVNTVATN